MADQGQEELERHMAEIGFMRGHDYYGQSPDGKPTVVVANGIRADGIVDYYDIFTKVHYMKDEFAFQEDFKHDANECSKCRKKVMVGHTYISLEPYVPYCAVVDSVDEGIVTFTDEIFYWKHDETMDEFLKSHMHSQRCEKCGKEKGEQEGKRDS
jgi:hypothetical protein